MLGATHAAANGMRRNASRPKARTPSCAEPPTRTHERTAPSACSAHSGSHRTRAQIPVRAAHGGSPRTADIAAPRRAAARQVVLYRAEGGELSGMWIAPDKEGLGADAARTAAAVEGSDVFKAFRRQLAKLSGGRRFAVKPQ